MPETVMQGEFVLELARLIHARMRVLPLIGGQSEKTIERILETWAQKVVATGGHVRERI